jgi:hypothetical protein
VSADANEYHPVMGAHTSHISSNKFSVQSSESQIPLAPQILDLARQPCIPTTRFHKPSLPPLPTCLASTCSTLPQVCQDPPPAICTADKRDIYRKPRNHCTDAFPSGPSVDLEAWTSSPTHICSRDVRGSRQEMPA